ncbi:MAG: prepilin peptidase [Alphaproteobacteria bacterium]
MVEVGIQVFSVALFPAALIYGGLSDLASYRIPNWLSVVLVAWFPLAAWSAGLTLGDVLVHFGAGLTVFAAGAGLFMVGALGGGDVKLLAAAATWTGFGHLSPFLLAVTLAGGALAMAVLILRRVPLPEAWRRKGWSRRLLTPGEGIPYGVAIAIAGVTLSARLGAAGPVFGR